MVSCDQRPDEWDTNWNGVRLLTARHIEYISFNFLSRRKSTLEWCEVIDDRRPDDFFLPPKCVPRVVAIQHSAFNIQHSTFDAECTITMVAGAK